MYTNNSTSKDINLSNSEEIQYYQLKGESNKYPEQQYYLKVEYMDKGGFKDNPVYKYNFKHISKSHIRTHRIRSNTHTPKA